MNYKEAEQILNWKYQEPYSIYNMDESDECIDELRPKYPKNLFDDIVRLTKIPSNGKILEIGCGTGQATLPKFLYALYRNR